MADRDFFQQPILNSPYDYPVRHWELDMDGQPTQRIIENRRRAEFITPIPKPKKQKGKEKQENLVFDEGEGLSNQDQQYAHTAFMINGVREHVDKWRRIPNPNDWRVTPETAWLLQHWRHHRFNNLRPFFCQIEAVETAMETYWVPGVNNLKQYGRWAFAEFTDVYTMQMDFAQKVEAEFNRMITHVLQGA